MVGAFLGGALGGATVHIIISAVDKFSSEFNKAQGAMRKLSVVSERLTKVLATGLTGAVIQAGKFEKEMSKLKIVTQGNTLEFQKLSHIIKSDRGGLFSQQDTAAALAFAKAAGVQTSTIETLLPRIKDAAAVFGEDLTTAVTAVTRAMKFGEAELAERIGLQLRATAVDGTAHEMFKKRFEDLTQEQKELVILNEVLKQTEKFKGAAAGATENFFSQVSKLKTGILDLAQSLGEPLLPILKTAAEKLKEVVDLFKELPDETKKKISITAATVAGGAGIFTILSKLRGQTRVTPMYVEEVGVGGGIFGGKGGKGGVGGSGMSLLSLLGRAFALASLPFLLTGDTIQGEDAPHKRQKRFDEFAGEKTFTLGGPGFFVWSDEQRALYEQFVELEEQRVKYNKEVFDWSVFETEEIKKQIEEVKKLTLAKQQQATIERQMRDEVWAPLIERSNEEKNREGGRSLRPDPRNPGVYITDRGEYVEYKNGHYVPRNELEKTFNINIDGEQIARATVSQNKAVS